MPCPACPKPRVDPPGKKLYSLRFKEYATSFSYDLVESDSEDALCRPCWLGVLRDLYSLHSRYENRQIDHLSKTSVRLIRALSINHFQKAGDLAMKTYGVVDKVHLVIIRADIRGLREAGIKVITRHGEGYRLGQRVVIPEDLEEEDEFANGPYMAKPDWESEV